MRAVSRRGFFAVAAGAAAVAAGCSSGDDDTAPEQSGLAARPAAGSIPDLPGPPFTLGVASGDPLPDRVVLWTRLAPEPLAGGGMPDEAVSVTWEVSQDAEFDTLVASGLAVAEPAYGHAVHVDAGGLEPDSWYWYRFRLGTYTSAVGRARTAPADGTTPASGALRLGFGSCQSYQAGYYTAHRHLAQEDLDAVVWLGDFIYEGGVSQSAVRPHDGPEVRSVEEYRNRYAQYLGDLNLQVARAAAPWLVIWDDHEVENNYAGATSEDAGVSPEEFLARRADAYKVWWEHQPVRLDPPQGPDLRIYRTVRLGSLASIVLTDQRQYRSPQACGPDSQGPPCGEEADADRTLLGQEQRDWLLGELAGSSARWNVLGNPVVMTALPFGPFINFDQWDGYQVDQRTVAAAMAARPDLNPLVLTGDIHAFGVADIKTDYTDPAAPAVGTEFVGGAISSTFPEEFADVAQELVAGLPQVKFVDVQDNGYGVLELTEDGATCALRAVSTTAEPEAEIRTLATFTVAPGSPGAVRVS